MPIEGQICYGINQLKIIKENNLKLFVLLLSSLLVVVACSSINRVNLATSDSTVETEKTDPETDLETDLEIDSEIDSEVPKVEMLKSKLLVRVVASGVKIYGEISADGKTFMFGELTQYKYKTSYKDNDYSQGVMIFVNSQATGIFNKSFSYDAKNNTVNIHTDDGGIFQLIDLK